MTAEYLRQPTKDILTKVSRLLAKMQREEDVTMEEIETMWLEVQEHLQGADRPGDN
jgi:chorismate mutase